MDAFPPDATFSIGDLSAAFGVTARTLRYYETRGFLRPFRRGQTRIYSARDRARLALVLRGKRVGFALDDIKELLDLHEIALEDARAQLALLRRLEGRIVALERQRIDIDRAIVDLRNGCEWLEERLADREPSADLRTRAAAFEAFARAHLNDDGVGGVVE